MHKSAIITIGNEILLGKTLNTNLAWLAGELALLGLPVEFSLTVKDEPEAIRQALQQAWGSCDVVVTTGGLGPTNDDITKREIAAFFGAELRFDPEIWDKVQQLFAARNLATPQINRNQALVPEGFTALPNLRGTAPGLFHEQSEKSFFAFAGVPLEMRHVFSTQAKPLLRQKYGSAEAIHQETLHTFGISESALAELLSGFAPLAEVSMAWLPQTGRVDLRFYGGDLSKVTASADNCLRLVGEHVWGRNADTPVSVLHGLLRLHKLTLTAAESCTGGLLQKMVTDQAGASDVFLGGVISYSNALKQSLLRVKPETLAENGAVSETCAREMAEGIKHLTESQTAISITGVAGPDGGTPQKPVGTVCFGFSVLNRAWSLTQTFNGDRESIRHKAAEFALLHLIKHLQGTRI
ncbi:MAG: competence/damage-inducible protein A [Candidatus Cloacimonetes bacterium]|nr:competence/damage-inducible protein A [Candidatus Cloacimonadota bacterium]MDD3142599.1 competence/damage-inducible protein A [Candidatus Cloacimonadota bacterium]MDY0367062.1 competence/damage-inducible protein A [Candidatus Syntrophosphaera sp.]HOY84441.1 competence/damage-inducible protein A [Candidatus Syntrophosphaera sp.]